MAQPLEGIRVADFSHVMAGPYASHLLRLLGAEVIKIEAPGRGDAMRYYGHDRRYDGMAPAFIGVNAGKRSIALDLKKPEALEAARKIIASSDVVLENFRPGVIARLGLGYEEARALNPDIIYCSVSGYGQSGPMRDYPAIDNIVQATSGMMSLSGEPDAPPMRVGFPAVDTLTGQTAAFAILAALLRRERSGGGEYIDVAMLDASMAFMTSAVVPLLVTGKPLERTGNTGYSGQPTAAMFPAGDGHLLSLGVVQPNQFAALARIVGKPEWLDDPLYATPDLRRAHGDRLKAELTTALAARPAAEWEEIMSRAGVPCGVVRDVAEAAALEQLDGRRMRLPIHVPGLPDREEVAIVNAGFLFSTDGPHVDAAPPRLGEHGEAILAELGYDEAGRDTILSG